MKVKGTPGLEFSHGKVYDGRSKIRDGDVDGLRNVMESRGKPIRSTIIQDGDDQLFYELDKKGRANITETV